MKKVAPLLIIATLALGGYYAYTSGILTGNVGVEAPTAGPDLPDVGVPDADDVGDAAGDAADGVEDGAKTAADTIAGLDPAVWRILSILLVVACVIWVIKNPKRLAIALGLGIVALLVFIMSGQ